MSTNGTLTKKDLKSDQEVRWCPGCGDYAILSCVQGVMAGLGIPKEDMVVVSGIGCSSRFPYYMDTYGFHTIHGRAPAFATGIKVANPELTVWMVTGDGDGLSIGGNHLIHMLRRNVDVKILLFNNEIYGLTKGQYSPTSRQGHKTKATPYGSVDRPFNPISVALGASATFVARTIDTDQKHMAKVLEAAAAHKGSAFIEILQNCVIFNDGVFEDVASKKVRKAMTVDLHPGEPMVYGDEDENGLKMEGFNVARCAPDEASVWNASTTTTAPAVLMAEIERDPAGLPTPIGIFRSVAAPTFEDAMQHQMQTVTESKGKGKVEDLIYAGDIWEVE